jgi:CO dehydrogenase maturation factor
MKLAIAGKGGVGKTTICAGLALWLAEQGRKPCVVDADPDNTLGYALGWPAEMLAGVRPLSEMRDLLAERAGGKEGGGLFALSPPVSDLIADYTLAHGGVRLLVMGTVVQGGAGCLCPENATLRAILRELVAEEEDLLVDMVAGLEHLGRGTAAAMQGLLIVTDATAPALRTVGRIQRLAEDLRLKPLLVAANRVREEKEVEQVAEAVAPLPVVGHISYHQGLRPEGVFGGPAGPAFRSEIGRLAQALDAVCGAGEAA